MASDFSQLFEKFINDRKIPSFEDLAFVLSELTKADVTPSALEKLADPLFLRGVIFNRYPIVDNVLWAEYGVPVKGHTDVTISAIHLRRGKELLTAACSGNYEYYIRRTLTALVFLAENPNQGYTIFVNGGLEANPYMFYLVREMYPEAIIPVSRFNPSTPDAIQ